ELHALIRRLWGRDKGKWQGSYAHLAHDVANAPLEREQLDRYVSRSRRRAGYEAGTGEGEGLQRAAQGRPGGAAGDLDPFGRWEPDYAEDEEVLLGDAFADDGSEWDMEWDAWDAGDAEDAGEEEREDGLWGATGAQRRRKAVGRRLAQEALQEA